MIKEVEETFLDIEGFEGRYQVSNFGRIKSLERLTPRGRKVPQTFLSLNRKNKKGYNIVRLYTGVNKNSINKRVHRLVLQAFYPLSNPEDYQVNHIDGNKNNNNISNLEWCDQSENMRHAFDLGLNKPRKGEECCFSKLSLDQIKEIRSKYAKGKRPYQYELAEEYGVTQAAISSIVNRKCWN